MSKNTGEFFEPINVCIKDIVLNSDSEFRPNAQPAELYLAINGTVLEKARFFADGKDSHEAMQEARKQGKYVIPAGTTLQAQIIVELIILDQPAPEEEDFSSMKSNAKVALTCLYTAEYIARKDMEFDSATIQIPDDTMSYVWPYFRDFSKTTLAAMGFRTAPPIPFLPPPMIIRDAE